jgi:hypothetical protein
MRSVLEVAVAGRVGCRDHADAGKLPGGKFDASPGKIGGCHAMAPSCAAEKGAGIAGAMARELMNGSVQ